MIYEEEESIVFSGSSSHPSVPSDLTTIIEGDHDVSLFPISPAKFNRCNIGPEPPRLSKDFVKLWGRDCVVVREFKTGGLKQGKKVFFGDKILS